MPSTLKKGRPELSKIITNENLFEEIVKYDNMHDAYRQSRRRGGKYKVAAMKFSIDETYNLRSLQQSLIDETYNFGDYVEFMVYEPKERLINAPQYEDKIVQLSMNNILKQIYNKSFIYDSYACIDNKGTHKCVDRISYFMRKAKWQYGEEAYIVKMDVRKFFYSIDREIMKELYKKKITCKKTLRLLDNITDSADSIDPLGLPLGNTLSQISANIYMNEVDQYAKRVLGLKYYVRYADDIVIIVENKEKAIKVLKNIQDFTKENLNLKYNKKKTKIFPINQGVNAVGFKIHATHRLLRDTSKRNIKRKAKKLRPLIKDGQVTIEKAEQIFNSWYGHAFNACSHNFINQLIDRNDYIYICPNNTLKIDENKI